MENKKYTAALNFLYSQLPMFSRVGAAAYKPGLERTIALDSIFGHPHHNFKSIHIAGTNGKGSTSHMIASILMESGYKTGLYTSPHLVDFRERMRVNGKMIPKEKVVEFVEQWKNAQKNFDIKPSFFELTMMMAFDWFSKEKVDYAVIEVGMGGRLDSTNIISPVVTAITNISPDHMQFLGNTLEEIATEKAGIIKSGIPVVIGEADESISKVFERKAFEKSAPIIYAFNNQKIAVFNPNPMWGWNCLTKDGQAFNLPLGGDYQKKNLNTVLNIVDVLRDTGIKLQSDKIIAGIENVESNTGLMGRWTKISDSPLTICDTGHNFDGISYISNQLKELLSERRESSPDSRLKMVIGFVEDKDVSHILPLLPGNAEYFITQASIPRAMKASKLELLCKEAGLNVVSVKDTVKEAAERAKESASSEDIIFIGGSTFVVADFLS